MQRVAIIGYGAVAGLHADRINQCGAGQVVSVCGPDSAKASRFAAAHGIGRPETDFARALDGCDAAVICSPGPRHCEQGLAAVDRVAAVLVELPACSSVAEALSLAAAADRNGARLNCAHTSRYLEPFAVAREWLRQTSAGSITQIRYIRSVPPRTRSWTDDALLHHASHILDLLRWWFGDLSPVAQRRWPRQGPPQDLALLAELPHGAPVSLAVSYVSRITATRMTLIGSCSTLETDGFSFVSSDCAEWNREFEGQREYEQAIARQDADWLAGAGVPWADTIELMRLIERFRASESRCL